MDVLVGALKPLKKRSHWGSSWGEKKHRWNHQAVCLLLPTINPHSHGSTPALLMQEATDCYSSQGLQTLSSQLAFSATFGTWESPRFWGIQIVFLFENMVPYGTPRSILIQMGKMPSISSGPWFRVHATDLNPCHGIPHPAHHWMILNGEWTVIMPHSHSPKQVALYIISSMLVGSLQLKFKMLSYRQG